MFSTTCREKLLGRQAFKDKVFARDNNRCVFCKLPAVDAHHITPRKSWIDGGYYLLNGVSVCSACHWKCERNEITASTIWLAINISTQAVVEISDKLRGDMNIKKVEHDEDGTTRCILDTGNSLYIKRKSGTEGTEEWCAIVRNLDDNEMFPYQRELKLQVLKALRTKMGKAGVPALIQDMLKTL